MTEWRALRDRLIAAGVELVIEPTIRFAGEVGEQAPMFLLDPSGNALEFKAFCDLSRSFAIIREIAGEDETRHTLLTEIVGEGGKWHLCGSWQLILTQGCRAGYPAP